MDENEEPRNRAERRAFERARRRAHEASTGSRVLRAYGRDGKVHFEVALEADTEPHTQLRLIKYPPGYDGPLYERVSDAEAAGRLDLVRAYLYDPRHPPCYREARTGRDQLPSAPVEQEFRIPSHEQVPEALEKLRDEVWAAFPEGEIFPTEALLLAWVVSNFRTIEDFGSREAFLARLTAFLDESGARQNMGDQRAFEMVARLPDLWRRWSELRDAAEARRGQTA